LVVALRDKVIADAVKDSHPGSSFFLKHLGNIVHGVVLGDQIT
jgi:hypothetical protein